MKRILIAAAALVCASLVHSSAQAAYVGLPTTLDLLTVPGATTSVPGGPPASGPYLSFSDFAYSTANGLPASSVSVSALNGSPESGIEFSGAFTAAPNTVTDYKLAFVVTSVNGGPITDLELTGGGTPLGAGYGTWTITEVVRDGSGHFITSFTVNSADPDKTILLSGYQTLEISKDISVIGGNTTFGASVSIVDQQFSTGGHVPEPASMALFGIGLTGLLAYRRRMKKASV